MLQRKGIPRSHSNASYFHGGGSLLPTTTGDARSTSSRRRYYDYTTGAIGSISLSSVGKVLSVGIILFVAVTILHKVAWEENAATEDLIIESLLSSSAEGAVAGGLRNSQYWSTIEEQALPLSQFPSIQYALDHSDIVLLYFAASWCSMSTPITNLLDEKFGDILLPPETAAHKASKLHGKQQRRPISLVYVSSDQSEAQMMQYAKRHWIIVPFASEERASLKKHFQVAAKREMEELQMEQRLYEIPAIIIVSGESHNVVTTHGVEDLKEKGSEALIHWIKLLHTIKALEDKYY